MIKVKNLHKSFGNLQVLKGINEEIKQGEVVSIIGPSGSGKSTLAKHINALLTASEGTICENAEICVKEVKAVLKCPNCGKRDICGRPYDFE